MCSVILLQSVVLYLVCNVFALLHIHVAMMREVSLWRKAHQQYEAIEYLMNIQNQFCRSYVAFTSTLSRSSPGILHLCIFRCKHSPGAPQGPSLRSPRRSRGFEGRKLPLQRYSCLRRIAIYSVIMSNNV